MRDRSNVQTIAMLVSAVFVLVGILGFIPGITTNYDDLSFAGHDSDAKLLGLFQVSVLHNIVHLLFGLVGFALARTWEGARQYLLYGGVVYLLLFVYGLFTAGDDTDANFIPVNWADNILHLALGIGMIGLGLTAGRRADYAERPAV